MAGGRSLTVATPEQSAPVVLELAPLPREQLGPFLILGLEKEADNEQIQAAWAQRVIAARKNQVGVPLEDINWGREVVNDPDRRLRAEASSLNLDLGEGVLRSLADRFGVGAPRWQPRDEEKALIEHSPAIEVPSSAEIRQGVAVPEIPADLPAVAWLLEQIIQEPLDPWALPFPSAPGQST
jgi:hypothetical protein